MATRFTGWKADDGTFYETQQEAEQHERVTRFRRWCDKNICCGGPWTSRMVADALLEEWRVEPLRSDTLPAR